MGIRPLSETPTGAVICAVRSKDSRTTISTSFTLTVSPGFTVTQRSAGTPQEVHSFTQASGPMKGTVGGQFLSTAAATFTSM